MKSFDQLTIFYFTGTGNALRAAEWIVEEAQQHGLETQLLNIAGLQKSEDYSPGPGTLIGFCYPTHGFNAPPILIRFLMQFPRSEYGNRVVLLNTRAGMKMSKLFTPGISGLAQFLPAIILRSKGYRLSGYRPLDLPSNWISFHPGLKQSVVDSIFERCRRITKKFAGKILSGQKVYRGFYDLPIDLLLTPVALGYYFYGRYILAKTYVANNECKKCELCVKNCPVKAISMVNGKPFWTYRCENCMRCMNSCPQRAIQTPHGFTALAWWLGFSVLPGALLYLVHKYRLLDNLSGVAMWNSTIYNVSMLIFGGALVFGGYKLLHTLLKLPFLNRINNLTSLTRFRFWRRYRAPKQN